MNTLKITYIKSSIHAPETHKKIIRALGLRKLHQMIEQPDNPAIRGMVKKVDYLVRVEETHEG
jgi:large subunit ribosomal protein L30